MAGLLMKDFLYFKQQGKFLLLMIVFFAVFFSVFLKDGSSYLTAMIVVMSMSFVINTFAYDELAKWDRFVFSLPVTRKQAVLSRYLFALILSLATTAFAVLMTVIGRGPVTLEQWGSVYAAFGVSIVMSSVLIPLIYRFGVQKARIAMLFLFLAPAVLVMLVQKLNLSLFSGGAPDDAQIFLWLKLSPLILLVFFVGSVLISCGIMEKKEV